VQHKKLKKEQDLSTRYRNIAIRAVAAGAHDPARETRGAGSEKMKKPGREKAGR
jgi:hypothetical protein